MLTSRVISEMCVNILFTCLSYLNQQNKQKGKILFTCLLFYRINKKQDTPVFTMNTLDVIEKDSFRQTNYERIAE